MRGQIGIEIIGVVGFAFILLIPLFSGFYFYSNNYWERLGIEKADTAAGRLASAVDMVGAQGDGMLTQEIVVPDNVEKIEIRGNEVIFSLSTSFGTTEIVKATSHEAKSTFASLRAGSYMVKAEARKGKVTLGLE